MQVLEAGKVLALSPAPEEGYFQREIVLQENAELILHYRITELAQWQETCIIHLAGQGAKVKIRGILHGQKKADLRYLLTLRHEAADTESDIEFRGVAEDKSHLVFDGLIQVQKNVTGVIANEQNRNLLLSDGAIVESRPRLEIDSQDVVCRHGSTTGDLDEDQLFYLLSRGIPESEARAILIEAFLGFF